MPPSTVSESEVGRRDCRSVSYTHLFSAWITRIAHNLIIDFFRQTKSENTVSADQEETDVLNRRELADENVEDILVTSQIHTDVKRIMASLPEAQREVLDMRFYRNMSFKEIAEATGVSINTCLLYTSYFTSYSLSNEQSC